MPLGYHLTFRLADDRAIATDAAAFRRAALCFHRHGLRARLLAFCIVDTHAHALVACDRETALRFARGLAIALQRVLTPGVHFDPTRMKPVVDQRHLYSTWYYILRQHEHHGVGSDPFHDGSHLPDVVGLRLVDAALEASVRGHLPRVEIPLPPRGELVLENLGDGAAAVFGLRNLEAKTPHAVLARAAAVQIGQVGYRTQELAHHLELGISTVNRLRSMNVPRAVLRAVEGQARWRSAVGANDALLRRA